MSVSNLVTTGGENPGVFKPLVQGSDEVLEAFSGRAKGDFLGSHDLEGLVSVIDGREALINEVRRESDELRAYIGTQIISLLAARGFLDALPGYLLPDAASQSRVGIV
jgi:hypothetical protein